MEYERPYDVVSWQEQLRYAYETAKERMACHPDFADKRKKIIEDYPHFKTEKEALQAAIKILKEENRNCQIWVKIEKGKDGVYRASNWWTVSNDNIVLQAAHYIGMEQAYPGVSDDDIDIDKLLARRMRVYNDPNLAPYAIYLNKCW